MIVNCLVTKGDKENRLLDFSDIQTVKRGIDLIHEKLGADCDIYGVGFSLGANHLLRYVGDNYQDSGLKAVISISNPFDLLATCVKLKYRLFGFYDKRLSSYLKRPFME